MSDIDLDAIEREIGMLLDGPHVYSRVVPEMLAGHARALIAAIRERDAEIARLRLDEHRLNWLDAHPRIVVADRGERGFQWAARDADGACIWLGGLRQAIDRAREIEAIVAADAQEPTP